jgi:hypothetical protein
VVVLAGSLALGGAIGSAAPGAHAAKRKTIAMNETVDLHLVKRRGASLRESGTASGTLAGTVSGRFNTSNALSVTGTVTVKPYSGGSITLTAVVNPTSTGKVAQFTGGVSVKGGKGRYAHASGGGPVTGSVNRKSWHVIVHVNDAKLTY